MLHSDYWKKFEKYKKYNSPENQYTVRILAEMRAKDFADQKLIHSLNRSRLYVVTPECQNSLESRQM